MFASVRVRGDPRGGGGEVLGISGGMGASFGGEGAGRDAGAASE